MAYKETSFIRALRPPTVAQLLRGTPRAEVRIARRADPVQPYARSGNVNMRKPRTQFMVQMLSDEGWVSGHWMMSLLSALDLARMFDPSATKACVYDIEPVPERV